MSRFKVLLGLTLTWTLSGCAAFHDRDEMAWQTLHAVDTLQTFHLASDPRYKEVESAWLIGDYPDEKALLAWSAGISLAHAGVTQLLIDNDFPRLSKAWQYLTLSSVCNAVGRNASIGIRIGGPNTGPDFQIGRASDASNRYYIPPTR